MFTLNIFFIGKEFTTYSNEDFIFNNKFKNEVSNFLNEQGKS